jgi:choice-of-anchor A domain-containing protein
MSYGKSVAGIVLSCIAVCSSSLPLKASALPLGAATGYNVFLFSNFSESWTDAEGRMAVGGNFTSNGFTVASNRSGDGAGVWSLVVGGNYTNAYNRLGGGDLFVGGNMYWNTPTLPNDAYVNGNVTNTGWGSVGGKIYYGGTYASTGTLPNQKLGTPAPPPIDFLSAKTDLSSLSANLSAAEATGTVGDNGYGTYSLAGTAGVNVFNLSKSSYSGSTINISAPAGATVIVNVAGSAASFNGGSVNISGTDKRNVIFNFGSATAISLSSIGFNGTILAPFADITGSYGNINGQVIANSFSGTTEFHDFLFTGSLPARFEADTVVSSTPEPGTWAMLAGGLLLFAASKLKSKVKFSFLLSSRS